MQGLAAISPMLAAPAITLLLLLLILAASAGVFVALVRRDTLHRRRVALEDWALAREMKLDSPGSARSLPPLMEALASFNPAIEESISGKNVWIARILTRSSRHPIAVATPLPVSQNWNLLLRQLGGYWPTVALRPTAHAASISDLFSLSSFPSLASTERFMVFGNESAAARALASSTAAALVPADVGLVLHENQLILDFSSRPFDQLEFGRMLDLAEQLAARLPSPLQAV